MVKTPKVWIVVCRDLHIASGLYTDIKEAVAVARESTKRGECQFVPVEIFLGENVEYIDNAKAPDTIEGIEKFGGGYL